MDIRRHLRRQAQYIIGPFIGLSLSGYFAYNLLEGDRGLIAWVHLTQEIRDAKAQEATVQAQREATEHRVSLLQAGHLDLDLLDEQTRAALNLVKPGEVVILNQDDQK